MTTEADLRKALQTASLHLNQNGMLLIVPDFVKGRFRPVTEQGSSDGPKKPLRFMEWFSDPDPKDSTVISDFILALKDERGNITTRQDRHIFGLFGKKTWISILISLGFKVQNFKDIYGRVDFIGFKLK